MRGLLGRKELPRGDGMLLRPAASVHTAFMRFPIDVVFLDAELRVVHVAHSVPPWRVVRGKRAKMVVELERAKAKLLLGLTSDRVRLPDAPNRLDGAAPSWSPTSKWKTSPRRPS